MKIQNKILKKQIINYFFVAMISSIFDFTLFRISRDIFKFNLEISNTMGFIIGLSINYFLSLILVFKQPIKTKKTHEIFLVILIGLIGLVINNIILNIFSRKILIFMGLAKFISRFIFYHEIKILESLAKIFALIITFGWNFFARKYLVYKN